jgi:hypothetical protein
MVPIIYLATETRHVVFLEKYFSTPLVTKVRGLFCTICGFAKKYHRLFFLERIIPIIYLGHEETKSCVFRKTFFDNFDNESSCIFLLWVANSLENNTVYFFFETNGPNHLFSHEVPKSCIFRKTFFDNFWNESSCFSYSNLHVREKLARFSFYRKKWSNYLFRPWTPQKLCF